MKIALIGYGKMGKAIEEIALSKSHEIVLKITEENVADFTAANLLQADVAIEFTGPESAPDNVKRCLEAGVPVVCGSTGWLSRWQDIVSLCNKTNGTFLYSSNFSIGVNLFFEVNVYLAKLMNDYDSYNVQVKEIHHTQKKDAPSGTAISLAEGILQQLHRKTSWVNHPSPAEDELAIISERTDPAPGTHLVSYSSPIDDIEIIHTAHNRTGFAAGAVKAAEFLVGRQGIYNMKHVLGL